MGYLSSFLSGQTITQKIVSGILKYCLSFVFICQGLYVAAQSAITWDMSLTVAPSSSGNEHPRLALDRNGNPLLIWHHASRAMFARWNGTGFSTPVLVHPPSLNVAGASWMGPDITSYGDTVYIVIKQTPENSDSSHIYCVSSFDGGTTFSLPVQVDNIGDSLSRFPTVTTDAIGNPIVGFMKFNSAFLDSRWAVSHSNDFGSSFSTDTKASGWSSPTSVICDCCPGAVACSGSTVAMLYRDNDSDIRDIWAGLSANEGTSFVRGMNIDQNYWYINACPATGPDGVIVGDTLYSTYMSAASGSSLVYRNASSLSSGTGSQGLPVTGMFSGLSSQNYPRIATDGASMAIVWKQRAGGTDQCMLQFAGDLADVSTVSLDTVDQGDVTNADVVMANGKIFVVWEDDNTGTIQFRSGIYNATAEIFSVKGLNEISIYPNPSSSGFHIATTRNIDNIRIVNIFGQVVYSSKPEESNFFVPVNEPGVYFLQLDSGNKTILKKVVLTESSQQY